MGSVYDIQGNTILSDKVCGNDFLLNVSFSIDENPLDPFVQNSNFSVSNGHLSNSSASTLWLSNMVSLNERETAAIFSLESSNARFAFAWKSNAYANGGSYFSVTLNSLNIHKSSQNGEQTAVLVTDTVSLVQGKKYVLKAVKHLSTNVLILIDGVTGETITTISTEQTGRSGQDVECPGGRQLDTFGLAVSSGTVFVYSVYVKNEVKSPYVVVYGDSMTEGARCYENETYGYLLKQALGDERVALSGESGSKINSSAGVISKIAFEIPKLAKKPKYVMVTIGTNGGNSQENFNMLYSLILTLGCVPIINVPPMGRREDEVRRYVANLKCKSVRFDIATAVNNDISQGQNTSLFADEIHPNPSGQLAMFNRIKADVPELFDYTFE